jgi:hypothetical protein
MFSLVSRAHPFLAYLLPFLVTYVPAFPHIPSLLAPLPSHVREEEADESLLNK